MRIVCSNCVITFSAVSAMSAEVVSYAEAEGNWDTSYYTYSTHCHELLNTGKVILSERHHCRLGGFCSHWLNMQSCVI